jgi:WD40 repeat protein
MRVFTGLFGRPALTIKNWTKTYALAPSLDGRVLALGDGSAARLWDAKTGEIIQGRSFEPVVKPRYHIDSLAFSPDGKIFGGTWEQGKVVTLWEYGSCRVLHTLSKADFNHYHVAISPAMAASSMVADQECGVMVWDIRTGDFLLSLRAQYERESTRLHHDYPTDVAFSPTGQVLAHGTGDGTVRIWDLQTKQEIHRLGLPTQEHAVTSVRFSPDGSQVVDGSTDKTARIWDVQSGSIVETLSGHSDKVFTVAWSPDGKLLASAGADRSVLLWNAHSGKLIRRFTGHPYYIRAVAFSPDSKLLWSGGEVGLGEKGGVVNLWSLD